MNSLTSQTQEVCQQPMPVLGQDRFRMELHTLDRQRAVRAMEAAEESLRKEHDAEAVAALSRAHARLNATGGLAGTTQGAH